MGETTNLQQIISEKVEHIKSLVQNCSTESVVGYSMVKQYGGFPQPGLSSPAKQIRFLLGVMLETEEPPDPNDFAEKEWKNFLDPIETLAQAYMSLYMPTTETIAEQSQDWSKSREVAMTAFLDYHHKGLLASSEQVSDRIRSYLSPFDGELFSSVGISASDALKIALDIGIEFQAQMDRVSQYAPNPSSSTDSVFEFIQAVNQLGKTRLSDLVERYGRAGQRFWDLFTVGRGEGPPMNYPTERSIVETRPFIRISDDVAMLFNFNILLSAILLQGEETLTDSPIRERHFRKRDKTLEDQATIVLSRILGANAEIYRNVFETPNAQYEHDLVVLTRDICLFVEAKASPPDEPFRDPEKAFVRLRRSFHSDTGIQKAYDQSIRLFQQVSERELVLFDEQGNEVLRLSPDISGDAFCVCVTRDSFGPQATFLSLLLSRRAENPYPWAVNIMDLEQIADAWEYFGWDGRQLKTFLSQRILLHDQVFSDDELDYVGAFVKHCGLHHFVRDDYDLIQLDPTYATVFDGIYFHVHHGQPRTTISPTYPFTTDLKQSLKAGKPVSAEDVPQGPIVVGRNENCPCGSTVKFKRCHGR